MTLRHETRVGARAPATELAVASERQHSVQARQSLSSDVRSGSRAATRLPTEPVGGPVDEQAQARRELAGRSVEDVHRKIGGRMFGENLHQDSAFDFAPRAITRRL